MTQALQSPAAVYSSFEELRFAAMQAANALKTAGYAGSVFLRPDQNRVELLGAHPATPGRFLHHTWWPGGHAYEWLRATNLDAAKAAIEV